MPTLAWPRRSLTIFGWTPDASMSVACAQGRQGPPRRRAGILDELPEAVAVAVEKAYRDLDALPPRERPRAG